MTVRTYDSKNTFSRGVIQPPVVGKIDCNEGIFEEPDTFNGIPIIVRYTWTVNPKGSEGIAKWEQASSSDNGKTWETNWYNEFIHDDNCTPTP